MAWKTKKEARDYMRKYVAKNRARINKLASKNREKAWDNAKKISLAPNKKIHNNYETCGAVTKIDLGDGSYTLIDTEDFARVANFKWALSILTPTRKIQYAFTSVNSGMIFLHRWLLQENDKKVHIDHRNMLPLDNRKSNLRRCTIAQNLRNVGLRKTNKTGFKGVSWHSRYKRYQANITYEGKQRFLGLFDTPEAAAAKYDEYSIKLHGEFGRTNKELE